MHIFYDARWTRLDTHDGISRYGASLLTALAKQHSVTMIIHDKRQLALLPDVSYVMVNSPFSIAEFFLAHKLNGLGADVVYSPLQIMGMWGRRYKLILTLQDMIYYHNPKPPTHLPAAVRAAWWLFHKTYWPQRWLLNQADYVTTVSKTSRQQITDAGLTSKPIEVIYNAPPPLKAPPRRAVNKNLVYMGSFMPYKNSEALIKAMNLLPDYELHMMSRITAERKAELLKLTKNPAQIVWWNGASDDDYATTLSGATALVTASKDEGFGLPIIEAMSLGVPVACTDMPIFREVAEDAALFFEPDSPEQIANCIHQIEQPNIADRLSIAGKKQAANFSWDSSAKALLQVMKNCT